MADGYSFGGEGDWKTVAMVRALKVMNVGLEGGTSFMEDFADIAGIELLVIDEKTTIREFKDKINANEAYYHLFQHGHNFYK